MVQDSQDSKFPKELGEGILRNFSRTLALLQPCYPCFRKMKKWREHGHSPDLSDGSNSGVRVLGDPFPARVFAGTSWRLLCQQRWMPSPQRWCTPFRPGCWCPALHGIRQPIPEDDGLAMKILICACHIPQNRLDIVGMILLMAEILHQLRLVVFLTIYSDRVLYIPGGCLGFLQSTDIYIDSIGFSWTKILGLCCWKSAEFTYETCGSQTTFGKMGPLGDALARLWRLWPRVTSWVAIT